MDDKYIKEDVRPFGRLIKFWRSVHCINQEELAFRIHSASRHISRLENGQAHPNREMVEKIAAAFSLSDRDKTNLLFSAHYTNEAPSLSSDFFNKKNVYNEVLRGVKSLDPYPTIVFEARTGEILMVNKGWVGFQRKLFEKLNLNPTSNFFSFIFDYADKQNLHQEWEGSLSVFLLALQQAYILSEDEKVGALLKRLLSSSAVPNDWQKEAASREAGLTFRVNVEIRGTPTSFFTNSQTKNLLGPLTFTSIPDMIIMTFYPEQENVDLSSLVIEKEHHSLLFY